DSIDVAQAIVESLPDNATVSLLACDVEPIVLAKASKPSSDSITDGFKKLELRVPLGTTDLAGALRAARRELGDEKDTNIVYIGDGYHRSNLLNTTEFESLVDSFRESRTSIHSLAIGPETDCELLAVFSSQTGGRVLVRQNISATCQQIGNELAKAAVGPVFWPATANWPTGVESVLPGKLPPMRLDRDSILIGRLQDKSVSGKVTLTGSVLGAEESMTWDVASEPSNPDLAFLGQIFEKSAPNAGLLMPLPGSDALRDVGAMLASSAEQLVKDARFALNSGDIEAAINIANEAIKRSPNSLTAKNILEAAQKTPKTSKPVKTEKGSRGSIVKFVSAQIGNDPFEQPPTGADEGDDPFGEAAPSTETPEETMPAEESPFGDDPAPASPFPAAPAPGSRDAAKPASPAMPLSGAGSVGGSDNPFSELSNASQLLEEDEGMRRVAAEALEREVKAQLSDARRSKDPAATKE
ncbi:MAG: hypothetical protein ACOVQM_22085, partial [Pirellula sp.]